MVKPALLIIIDNLAKGGAEVLLVGILKELNTRFKVIIVNLSDKLEFEENLIICDKRYSLGVTGKFSYIPAIFKLKKIIRTHKPALIHSHLIYSTLLARMACPSKTPLIFSIHNELSKNVFNHSRRLSFFEKKTITNKQNIIAVSNSVLKDYEQVIPFKGRKFILENYISDNFYSERRAYRENENSKTLKIVALGNIKKSKNYEFLIRSFIYLKRFPVSLHIYGNKDHVMYKDLQAIIDQNNLPVEFMGPVNNVSEMFSKYDLYVMSSTNEGFGIAAVEAMACGLPLILSDLQVLKEITVGNAIFFDLNDPQAFANKVEEILDNKIDLNQYSQKGIEIAKRYTKRNYLEKLFSIYNQVL